MLSFSQDRKNERLLAKLSDLHDGYELTTDFDVMIYINMFPYSQLLTLNFSGSCSSICMLCTETSHGTMP